MQGRWLDVDDGSELVVDGFDVRFQGQPVRHDFFVVDEDNGALAVTLGIDDVAGEDTFQRENITGLVVDPEGEFHAFNTRFGVTLARADA